MKKRIRQSIILTIISLAWTTLMVIVYTMYNHRLFAVIGIAIMLVALSIWADIQTSKINKDDYS